VDFTSDVREGCEPLEVNFTNTTVSSAALSACVWNMGNGTIINGCGPISYTYPNSGTYDVTLTTTDLNGCSASDTKVDYIYVEATPIAAFTASNYSVNNLTTTTQIDFTNESIGATNYEWSYSDGGSSTVTNPSHVIGTTEAGTFAVTLVAISNLGCIDSITQFISITEELIYYIPNSFTPDGDSYNNTFQPVFTSGFDPYNFTMLIFNRWGEIIFETHNADIGWDGSYNGKLVQDGTYTWKIEFKSNINDKKYSDIGHVNMLR